MEAEEGKKARRKIVRPSIKETSQGVGGSEEGVPKKRISSEPIQNEEQLKKPKLSVSSDPIQEEEQYLGITLPVLIEGRNQLEVEPELTWKLGIPVHSAILESSSFDRKGHQNLVQHILIGKRDDKLYTVIQGWSVSLAELMRTRAQAFFVIGNCGIFNISSRLKEILKGVVRAISFLAKGKFGVKQVSASDIVFLEGDSEYSTPKLIDSYIIEGQSTGSIFRHVRDLMLSIVTFFRLTIDSLLPDVICFMDYLLDSESEEAILRHPFFMSRSEILDYVFHIRYAMRNPDFKLGVAMSDIDHVSSPTGWKKRFRRCSFMVKQLEFRKYEHTIEDFLTCTRDAAEHQIGDKFDFIGEVIYAFPKLFPMIYKKRGYL